MPKHRMRLAGRLPFTRFVPLATFVGLTAILVAGTIGHGDWLLAICALLIGALGLRGLIAQPGEGREASSPGQTRRDWDSELLAAGPDPIVTVDRRGVVTAANAAARTLVPAVKEGEPLAFSLRAPEVLDAVRMVAATGQEQDVEYGARTASEPLVAVRLRPLPARTGRASVALFFTDRTRERRVETMRVDFIATVSHELRTPLASLAGFIDTIAGPARNDAAARERFLGIMREQAGRMTRLVDDLLRLSRVELNEHLPPTDAVDLGALVAHMAEIMAPLARERGMPIGVELAKDLPAVRGDRDQLLRVVENLIENALKYGGRGDIVLRVRKEEGRSVALTVTDHGPGIAPEHIPRLTERFYRVDEAESRARGGTGLGLAIVKHVVGRHRGRLSIESELGRGTTVRILLPAFARPAA